MNLPITPGTIEFENALRVVFREINGALSFHFWINDIRPALEGSPPPWSFSNEKVLEAIHAAIGDAGQLHFRKLGEFFKDQKGSHKDDLHASDLKDFRLGNTSVYTLSNNSHPELFTPEERKHVHKNLAHLTHLIVEDPLPKFDYARRLRLLLPHVEEFCRFFRGHNIDLPQSLVEDLVVLERVLQSVNLIMPTPDQGLPRSSNT